jgi:drug/metabolite transporter (DMT)-like permease
MARPQRSPDAAPEPAPPHATRLGVLAVIGPICVFSVMNSIVKLSHVAALPFAFFRLWMGAAVMLGVLALAGRRLSLSVLRRAAPSGVLFAANIAFFFSALKLTSVADVLIVAALQPALTLLVAGPLFGERVTVHEVAWTALSLVGVVMVVVGSSGTPVWSLAGDLLAAGALFAFTIYWLLSKQVRKQIPAIEYMTAVTMTAALVITPIALVSGESFSVRWQDWLWLVLFVAGAQAGHSLLAWSHAQVDVTISSLLILIEPAISAVAALIILGEPLPPLSIAGGLLAIGAVGAVVWRATRRSKGQVGPEVAPA